MNAAILKFGRTVLCGGCNQPFFDAMAAYGAPYCCPRCAQEAEEASIAEVESIARANGFESFERWAAAGYPEK